MTSEGHNQERPDEFPYPQLVQPYLDGKLAILFGSGLSMGCPGKLPGWSQLPERLLMEARKLKHWTREQTDLYRKQFQNDDLTLEEMLTALDFIKSRLRPGNYRTALTNIFRPQDAAPLDVHHALVAGNVRVILTTNYDEIFEAAYSSNTRTRYNWSKSQQALHDIQASRNVLFKIHGSAEEEDSVIMTSADYTKLAGNKSYQRIISYLFQEYTFLLIGFGINDPLDLDNVLTENHEDFGPSSRTHYAFMTDKDSRPYRDHWLRKMNIDVLKYRDHDELPGILRSLWAIKDPREAHNHP